MMIMLLLDYRAGLFFWLICVAANARTALMVGRCDVFSPSSMVRTKPKAETTRTKRIGDTGGDTGATRKLASWWGCILGRNRRQPVYTVHYVQ